MKNVKTFLNYDQFDRDDEVNNLPSLTIPDQAMSVRTILDRYSRGLPVTGFNPVYEGEDEYFPDLKTLDLSERQDLLDRTRSRIAELQSIEFNKNNERVLDKNNERVLEKESISGEPSGDL